MGLNKLSNSNYYMEHERRRDRVWKNVLLMAYRYGEVNINNLDVKVTDKVETYDEAMDLIAEEEYRSDEDITKNPDGTFTVVLEPDMSDTGKRSVLKTLSSDRYNFLTKSEKEAGVWETGPLLKVLFGFDDNYSGQRLVEVSGPAAEHPELEGDDIGSVIKVVEDSGIEEVS